jgi:radical SAM/Cys-rich protein
MPQKESKTVMEFKEAMGRTNSGRLKLNKLQTLQVNLGNICNQRCTHCHIEAGPDGKKIMPKTVMRKIIDLLRSHPGLCVDITGGCPELNPDFKFILNNVYRLVSRLMVRTNLTVFYEPGLDWVPMWYSKHDVVLIASLPCYTEENVKKQRGGGVFTQSIDALRMLNDLGYGVDDRLELNLVYNPGGNFLPGVQEELETAYKRQLNEKYGIRFNKLFTMTNAPIGRFKHYLKSNGRLQQYQELLAENFNSAAAENVMCRNLVSVDYRGLVYNCDFNQALDLPIIDARGSAVTVETLEEILSGSLEIITGEHCFCCTAGAGSSCTGAVVK